VGYSCSVSTWICKLSVKDRRVGGSALVTKEVIDHFKLLRKLRLIRGVPLLQLLSYQLREHLFSFNLRELNMARWFSFEKKFLLCESWQRFKDSPTCSRELCFYKAPIIEEFGDKLGFVFLFVEHLIDLFYELSNFWQVYKKTFRNNHNPEILIILLSLHNDISNILHGFRQTPALLSNLLTDKNNIWLRLQRTLKNQMRGISTHETNEVPVLKGRSSVYHDVSN
jgi:hypothetical protein